MTQQVAKQSVPSGFAREQQLIRLLMFYLGSGLFFMVLPGTFLGVWNLFAISNAQSSTSVPVTWIQAHGHAQLFGWLGSFILGIGFYSIPNLRRVSAWSFWDGWLIWDLWTAGVGIRWLAEVYFWQWRVLIPLSSAFELTAVVLFLARSSQGHRQQKSTNRSFQMWTGFVIAGTMGLLVAMGLNAFESFSLAMGSTSPAFPQQFDNMFLIVSIWGFAIPVAWGFTAHWMPAFLGLKPFRERLSLVALATTIGGIIAATVHAWVASAAILLSGAILMVAALRILERSEKPAKVQGVHKSFPVFMRMAYVWLLVAAALLVWAALQPGSPEIGGAGRHAITVGYLMTMVFTVGPRILPAFLGRKGLFSELLMLVALVLTNTGCFLRVSSEIIAYQHAASWAWVLLPLSATLELTGVVVFTTNMIGTFRQPTLLDAQDVPRVM